MKTEPQFPLFPMKYVADVFARKARKAKRLRQFASCHDRNDKSHFRKYVKRLLQERRRRQTRLNFSILNNFLAHSISFLNIHYRHPLDIFTASFQVPSFRSRVNMGET